MKRIWLIVAVIVILGMFYFISKFYGYLPDFLGLFQFRFF